MALHGKNRLPSIYDCARLEIDSVYPYFSPDVWRISEKREKLASASLNEWF
jgi:hypothetical protein